MWAYCAVDIFALISGYVCYTDNGRRANYSGCIVMWLQAVVYGVAVTLLFGVFAPELVTTQDLIQMVFPVTNGLYWYLTAYIGLVFLMPVLNAGLRKCSKSALKKMFFAVVAVFSVWDNAIGQFGLGGGTLLYG